MNLPAEASLIANVSLGRIRDFLNTVGYARTLHRFWLIRSARRSYWTRTLKASLQLL